MLRDYQGISPKVSSKAYIAEEACVIGDVSIDDYSTVWPMVVIRGDVNPIKIGKNSNIQDGTVVHTTGNWPENNYKGFPLTLGDNVTIGHNCTLHGCILENNTFIGMGTIILDGCVIQKNSMVGAGSLVTQRTIVESGFLYFGNPAKKVRPLKPKEIELIQISANNYVNLGKKY